jgi:hypothetical protein
MEEGVFDRPIQVWFRFLAPKTFLVFGISFWIGIQSLSRRAPQDRFCEAFLFANVIASLNEVKVWQSHGFN